MENTHDARTALDVPGIIRRARRSADLSQRELAVQLGVGRSTVGRWESGEVLPDLEQFQRLLGLAALHLTVVDSDGGAVEPMADEAPRDGQRRRFPAHLDLGETTDPLSGEPRLTTPHRPRRDRNRAAAAAPQRDHPPLEHFLAERDRRRQVRHARALELVRRRLRFHPPPPEPSPCSCPMACEESAYCVPKCPCQYEAAETATAPTP